MQLKDDKHKVLNSIIMDIEKQKHIIDRSHAFIQSTLITLEISKKLEGEEKDYLIKDLREKLNEKEKASATLVYLKYTKMKDEMKKLEMHGGPDDYLENLEEIKKEQGIDNLYSNYKDRETLDQIIKNPEKIIKLE